MGKMADTPLFFIFAGYKQAKQAAINNVATTIVSQHQAAIKQR
jgi:hypothetical protein